MKEQHLILNRHLTQLEVDKAGIDHAIDEMQRRFALLDEVESWGLLVKEEPFPGYHRDDSWYDCYEKQDNYKESGEDTSWVPAGFSLGRTPSWARLPLVA